MMCDYLTPITAVQSIYPEVFPSSLPPKYWNDVDNQKKFLKDLENRLGITNPEDWQRVRLADIIAHGGRPLMAKYRYSLMKGTTRLYPYLTEMQRYR